MRTILAIDPGPVESAYAVIDARTCRPLAIGKEANTNVRDICWGHGPEFSAAAVEMVASYGMAVGAEVFETCVWTGRYCEALDGSLFPHDVASLVKRLEVKLHHCHDSRAKDSNIVQALVDRFAPGQPNRGKGTKAAPGWFHGFSADIWQAYALAVYVADMEEQAA